MYVAPPARCGPSARHSLTDGGAPRSSQVLLQVLNFVSVLASGLMIWKGLGLATNTESPIVVVLRWALALALIPPLSARGRKMCDVWV